MFIVGLSVSGCRSTLHKKSKGCKGNGSWYGNRNLAVQQLDTMQMYDPRFQTEFE
jgi:hypothetical protein